MPPTLSLLLLIEKKQTLSTLNYHGVEIGSFTKGHSSDFAECTTINKKHLKAISGPVLGKKLSEQSLWKV